MPQDGAFSHGSGGRRRSADAELWRPCESDVARGNRGEVESLALPAPNSKLRTYPLAFLLQADRNGPSMLFAPPLT